MPATEFWFSPDEEFFAAMEDYAFVGRSTSWALDAFQDSEDLPGNDSGWGDDSDGVGKWKQMFSDVMPGYMHGWNMWSDAQLVYADVDHKDPTHADINIRIAKEGAFEEETQKSKEAREKLIDHLTDIACDPGEVDDDESDSRVGRKEVREREERHLSMGADPITPWIVDYLMGLEDDGDREATLSMLSKQHLRKTQRPVLLLIDMVTEGPMTPLGRTGWAMAYNFHENRVIIKPCVFDQKHHPLAEKWDTELPDDGICFSGHPTVLVDRVLQLHADIQGEEYEKDPVKYGFRMVVLHTIGTWLVRHWKALAGIPKQGGNTALTDKKLEEVDEATKAIFYKADKIKLPETRHETKGWQAKQPFLRLQRDLEACEEDYREEAIRAKAQGKEDLAKRMVELYNSVFEQLQAFNNMTAEDQ
ncbi:MAG: hypothetical protein LQ348_005757 [Seirophora lacunosa]|nr:MAG: hypothetical protein LQ348_005757 [Seirophora lacunosa]